MITTARKETNAEYHADKSRYSNSQLTLLKRSPKLFKAVVLDGIYTIPRTPAMKLGDYTHCATIEPQEFHSRYVIRPDVDGRTKAGKAILEAFRERIASGEVEEIALEDYDRAMRCADALRAHPELKPILTSRFLNSDAVESRIDFRFNGLDCRCKPDLRIDCIKTIIDIKTCIDPSPEKFGRHVMDFGYFRQDPLYRFAAQQKTGDEYRFLFAVVGSKEPHETAVYELKPSLVDAGTEELWLLTTQLKLRLERNDWESVWSRGVAPLDKPRYYDSNIYQLEDLEEESDE